MTAEIDAKAWPRDRTAAAFACVCTAALAVVLDAHALHLNGPAYWRWPWRRIDGWRVALGYALALAPFAAAQAMHARRRGTIAMQLALVMLSLFLLQLVSIGLQTTPFSLAKIRQFVENPVITSYYTDAMSWLRGGLSLREYLDGLPMQMAKLTGHAQTKPPGGILYYAAFCRVFGAEPGGILAALGVAALATLAAPATYVLGRDLAGSRERGFLAASAMSLAPGLVLFHPELDQLYPLFSAGVVALWFRALHRNDARAALGAGILLSIACFFAYNLLVLGALLLAIAALWLFGETSSDSDQMLRLTGFAGLGFAAPQALAWALIGYHPVDTFLAAVTNQSAQLAGIARPYPATVLFDMTDFVLGLGWIAAGLAILGAVRAADARQRRVMLVLLAQPLLVAALGLLPGETARVWIFMMPLVAVPAAIALDEWRTGPRAAAFAAMALMLAMVCRNLVFLQ